MLNKAAFYHKRNYSAESVLASDFTVNQIPEEQTAKRNKRAANGESKRVKTHRVKLSSELAHGQTTALSDGDSLSERSMRKFAFLYTLAKNPQATIAGSFLTLLIITAVLASWLFPGDPLDMAALPLLWPGEDMQFPLGSDSLGRNVMAELAHGVRVSLTVGFFSAIVSLTIGLLIGSQSGFFGGRIDRVLMRVTELFQTIPSFLLVIVLVVIGGPQIEVIVFAIGVASWPVIARLVRAEFRTLREAEFILAARSQGFSHTRIIFCEMLPNALPPVIVTTSVLVATAILMEAGLAFLGLGDPNVASWGGMISEGRDQLRTAWYLTAIPGAVIVMTVLSLNLLGDALNDALNPHLRGTR